MQNRYKALLGVAVITGGLLLTHPKPLLYPDQTLPPKGYGVTNPNITQDNINQNICNPKWSTKSIRPPSSYTTKIKKQQLKQMGYKDQNLSDYAEDHIISLQLGGHPADPKNLWPESYRNPVNGVNIGAKEKDIVENYLHKQVCSGKISLSNAQDQIRTDWVKIYTKIKGIDLGQSESDN